VHSWHADVHEHDVGARRTGEADGVVAGAGLAHQLEVFGGVDQQAEAGADERLVVGQHHPDGHRCSSAIGKWARTANQVSPSGPTHSEPPAASTRSRMPVRPKPRRSLVASDRGVTSPTGGTATGLINSTATPSAAWLIRSRTYPSPYLCAFV